MVPASVIASLDREFDQSVAILTSLGRSNGAENQSIILTTVANAAERDQQERGFGYARS